jgi:hypothetical protein
MKAPCFEQFRAIGDNTREETALFAAFPEECGATRPLMAFFCFGLLHEGHIYRQRQKYD